MEEALPWLLLGVFVGAAFVVFALFDSPARTRRPAVRRAPVAAPADRPDASLEPSAWVPLGPEPVGQELEGSSGWPALPALTRTLPALLRSTVALAAVAAAVVLGELLIALGAPLPGLAVHVAALVVSAAAAAAPDAPRAFAALVSLPVIRVVSLCTSLAGLPPALWPLVLAVPLAVGVVLLARSIAASPRELGLRAGRSVVPIDLVVALGGLLLGAGYALLLGRVAGPQPAVPAVLVVLALVGVALVAALEEVIFRGLLQVTFAERLGPIGLAVPTVLFGALYRPTRSAVLVVVMTLFGALLALVVARTGSIRGALGAHVLFALAVALL
jgi:uncharacterized protein